MNPEDNKPGEDNLNEQQPGNAGAAPAENGGASKEDQGKPGVGDSGEANQTKPKENENEKQQGESANAGKQKNKQQEKKSTARAKIILDIMDANKANVLWENKSGEFFTSDNLALLSEKGEKERVRKHTRELIEATIDNA